jgi:hypothetical protein
MDLRDIGTPFQGMMYSSTRKQAQSKKTQKVRRETIGLGSDGDTKIMPKKTPDAKTQFLASIPDRQKRPVAMSKSNCGFSR